MLFTDLRPLLQAELELMEHFLFSLEKEHALLLDSYSNDDLFDLTELKNQYAEQLSQIAEQRDHALSNLQLPVGRDGLLAAQTQYETLHEPIQNLLDTAEKARVLNDENGLLIQTYLKYSVEALEALSEANPAGSGSQVYDAKGLTRSAASVRRGINRA